MSKGKLIVIEGTDCSGKQTQTDILVENLKVYGYQAVSFSFPNYETPTGKIIGDAYLGKNNPSYFKEGIENVGRTLPQGYFFFNGDGQYNHFRQSLETNDYWDWSYRTPYED